MEDLRTGPRSKDRGPRGVLLLHPVLLPIPRVKPGGLESVVLFVLQVGGCPPAAIDAQCRRRPFQLRLELHPMTCLAGDVPAGSSYVDRRLRASLYESDWADEQMGGVTYLFFLRKLANDGRNQMGRDARCPLSASAQCSSIGPLCSATPSMSIAAAGCQRGRAAPGAKRNRLVGSTWPVLLTGFFQSSGVAAA